MRLALAALLALVATPAFADAVTYKGTVGDREVVVEIIEPSDGPVGGRFTFLDTGGDIPLDPAASPDGMYYFAEEGPCGETECVPNSEGVADMMPRAATWALDIIEGGDFLTGTRTSESKKAIVERVELQEVHRRALTTEAPTPFGLHDRSAQLGYDLTQPLVMDNAAYETVLFSLPKVEGRRETFTHDTTITYMIDPRTKFEFPRITSLDDGSDPAVMNAKLEELQNRMSLSALDCLAFVYAAWGQTNDFSYAGGTLGDYDSENIEVGLLTPNLISWVQSGSLYCVGAHPYNHYDVYNYNVRTGEPIADQDIFSAWVPRRYGSMDVVTPEELAAAGPEDYFSWGPNQELIDFVQERMDMVSLYGGDQEMLEACASDEALADNLTVRYITADRVMFVLSGFPHVIGVCNGDLFAIDALDVNQFMHASAEDFFPSLAD